MSDTLGIAALTGGGTSGLENIRVGAALPVAIIRPGGHRATDVQLALQNYYGVRTWQRVYDNAGPDEEPDLFVFRTGGRRYYLSPDILEAIQTKREENAR